MTRQDNRPTNAQRKPNHLINEKSPYLLQHAYNPVDWHAWGTEAFEKAKKENKPIFLSIGYSTCHWCHVMAHESFEDEDIADFLNENFVSIKVDREERPDIDEIYMKAVVSITGSGGWPLTVFLTPKLEPFFGGTYFPVTPKYGLPGFQSLLRNISQAWRSDRKNISDSAVQMKKALNESYSSKMSAESKLDGSVLQDCYDSLAASFDHEYGGFSNSPKFPTPSNLYYLLHYHKLKSSKLALSMVTKTLDAMSAGGICDQLGGGFHRYSTDRFWLVPHFEKMLYDNALLAIAYLDVFLITNKEGYVLTAKEILDWVMREMTSDEGGFYSAQDADSPEGEGSYYVWNREEVRDALMQDPAISDKTELIVKYFSVSSEGNFEGDKSILTANKTTQSLANESGLNENEARAVLNRARVAMLTFRNNRPKPLTDDKMLTSWNGLMISAMSKAYSVLGEDKYLQSAKRAADFLLKSLIKRELGKPKLIRRYRGGEAKGTGVLEDYAFFINGLIDLYEASFEPDYLLEAISLTDSMIELFNDKNGGGFFQTMEGSSDLIVRMKDGSDGATPSGNSMAALTCLRLSEITGREDLRRAAEGTFQSFWVSIKIQPHSYTEMLVALMFYLGTRKEIVISGDLKSQDTKSLIETLRSQYLPNSVILHADKALETITELVTGRLHKENEPAKVYVCSNFSCKLPSSTREQLLSALSE